MANAEVIMPKMGDGMTEGTILSWKKSDGDQVKAGDIIAEIETDKSNVEIEAEDTGIFTTQVKPGEAVPVGSVIATIGDGKAATSKAKSAPPPAAQASAPAQPAPQPVTAPPAPSRNGERLKASPLARKIARERGIALEQVSGTGPNGRIIEADILGFKGVSSVATQTAAPTPVPSAPQQAPSNGQPIELTAIRKVIARRMTESKTTIPHFYVTSEVDMEAVIALRKELNSYDESLTKISINDFVVKAAALALVKVPDVNRVYQNDKIYQYSASHVGIAVALDDGLIVPVVKDANSKSLRKIAAEAKTLIDKARAKKLQPAEYSGGTFTVSNLGTFDVESFIAIIDPSQGAILAVASSRKVPVVMADDKIAIRQRMNITLSGDHRVMDGAAGARFLQEVKRLLQNPLALLEQ